MPFAKDLAQTLDAFKFSEVRELVYRHEPSAHVVDHYLYFLRRSEKGVISADFGFRHLLAEAFSIEAFARFGGNGFPLDRMRAEHNCSMRFSFWRFLSMEGPCCWPVAGVPDWQSTVAHDLGTHLIPFVNRVQTTDDMFRVLASDEEPCPWFATNAAIRLAQVIFLGSRLGASLAEMEHIAADQWSMIEHDLGSELTRQFVSAILEDAALN